MRRKKEGLLTRTRETMGTGIPKIRKNEGVFDRIDEKRLPIPSKKTCWEIFDVTLHHHITLVLSSLISPSSIAPIHHSPFSITIELIIPLLRSSTLHLS
jgi:hypothetical protein